MKKASIAAIVGYVTLVWFYNPSSDAYTLMLYAATLFLVLFGLISLFLFLKDRHKKSMYTAAVYLWIAFLGIAIIQSKIFILQGGVRG